MKRERNERLEAKKKDGRGEEGRMGKGSCRKGKGNERN